MYAVCCPSGRYTFAKENIHETVDRCGGRNNRTGQRWALGSGSCPCETSAGKARSGEAGHDLAARYLGRHLGRG